jgi:hypothetical protein
MLIILGSRTEGAMAKDVGVENGEKGKRGQRCARSLGIVESKAAGTKSFRISSRMSSEKHDGGGWLKLIASIGIELGV